MAIAVPFCISIAKVDAKMHEGFEDAVPAEDVDKRNKKRAGAKAGAKEKSPKTKGTVRTFAAHAVTQMSVFLS